MFNGLATGWLLEKLGRNYPGAIIANLVGAAIVLLFGALWLQISTGISFSAALQSAVIPFLVLGVIKAVAAAIIGLLITKRLPEKFLTPAK